MKIKQGKTLRKTSEADVNTTTADNGNPLLDEIKSTGKTRLRRVSDRSKANARLKNDNKNTIAELCRLKGMFVFLLCSFNYIFFNLQPNKEQIGQRK